VKLTIEKLGRIRQAELDIRRMTVFVGPNNTNKTWTAYSLYGLIRRLSVFRGSSMVVPSNDTLLGGLPSILLQRIAAITSSIVQRIDTTQTEPLVAVDVARLEAFDGLTLSDSLTFKLNTDALAQVLAVQPDDLCGAAVALTIDSKVFMENAILERMSVVANRSDGRLVMRAFEHGAEEPTTGLSWGRLPSAQEQGKMLRSIVQSFVESLILALYNRSVALPAERKAIAAFYQMFMYGVRRSEERGLNAPTVDFMSMLEQSLFAQDRKPAFPDILDALERELLAGTVDFTPTDPRERQLRYTPKEGPSLRMHATASMVRSLAGLDLYLRCFARPGDFLVIDEPEMNAHPQAQLGIVELLALLANKGVSVVVTTHSPYFVDHLNNLIEGSRANARIRSLLAPKFKLGAKSPWLSPDEVSVYLFSEKGEVSDIFDRTNAQIDVTTFSDVSDYVGNLYARVLEAQRRE
jgi:hypothetical protein